MSSIDIARWHKNTDGGSRIHHTLPPRLCTPYGKHTHTHHHFCVGAVKKCGSLYPELEEKGEHADLSIEALATPLRASHLLSQPFPSVTRRPLGRNSPRALWPCKAALSCGNRYTHLVWCVCCTAPSVGTTNHPLPENVCVCDSFDECITS